MKEGNVVIVAMPQADGSVKNRPTIILREMPPFQDMLVCGVSSQLHQEVKGFDEIISATDSDFAASSLVGKSLIRLGFLTVVPQSQIVGIIGSISSTRHQRLLEKLTNYLTRKS
ncbi:MAG: type II toxin-antitoxin system PemK/MazF family toxin [Acidobacteria bacterium]|jgi:mRNA interferase MazF|nr:type II toxin-antitoxin system PemK/MazF family toxin [Acidobacteriota bacterium]